MKVSWQPLPATRTPSMFLSSLGLEPRTLQLSAQSPTGWTPTTLDGNVYIKFKRKKPSCHQYLCKHPPILTICDHSITGSLRHRSASPCPADALSKGLVGPVGRRIHLCVCDVLSHPSHGYSESETRIPLHGEQL